MQRHVPLLLGLVLPVSALAGKPMVFGQAPFPQGLVYDEVETLTGDMDMRIVIGGGAQGAMDGESTMSERKDRRVEVQQAQADGGEHHQAQREHGDLERELQRRLLEQIVAIASMG